MIMFKCNTISFSNRKILLKHKMHRSIYCILNILISILLKQSSLRIFKQMKTALLCLHACIYEKTFYKQLYLTLTTIVIRVLDRIRYNKLISLQILKIFMIKIIPLFSKKDILKMMNINNQIVINQIVIIAQPQEVNQIINKSI
jgi:hypothetical protein